MNEQQPILTPEEVQLALEFLEGPGHVLKDEDDKEKAKRIVVRKDGVNYILTVVAQGTYDHQTGDTFFSYGVHSLAVADGITDLDEMKTEKVQEEEAGHDT